MERRHLLIIAAVSAVLAPLAMAFVDKPVALWIAAHDESPLWSWLTHLLEYPVGIAPWTWTLPILLVVGVLASLAVVRLRRYARAWMYVAIVYLLTRNLLGWSKTLTGRLRPFQWVHTGGSTFGHVGDGVSFPSGHVTVFGGLILPLVIIEPRARPLLALIPFVMVARVAVLAHFVSDVLAGLALTSLVAWAFAPLVGRLGRLGRGDRAAP